MRGLQGSSSSDLSDRYRKYDRDVFIETLKDWQWFGEEAKEPLWYKGEPRS